MVVLLQKRIKLMQDQLNLYALVLMLTIDSFIFLVMLTYIIRINIIIIYQYISVAKTKNRHS